MWKKGMLAGMALLIAGLGLNWLLGMAFPNIMKEYQNTAIFRPGNDPLMRPLAPALVGRLKEQMIVEWTFT